MASIIVQLEDGHVLRVEGFEQRKMAEARVAVLRDVSEEKGETVVATRQGFEVLRRDAPDGEVALYDVRIAERMPVQRIVFFCLRTHRSQEFATFAAATAFLQGPEMAAFAGVKEGEDVVDVVAFTLNVEWQDRKRDSHDICILPHDPRTVSDLLHGELQAEMQSHDPCTAAWAKTILGSYDIG